MILCHLVMEPNNGLGMNHLMPFNSFMESFDNFEAKLKYHYSEYENDGVEQLGLRKDYVLMV